MCMPSRQSTRGRSRKAKRTRRRKEPTLTGAQRGKTNALIVSANQQKAYPILKSLKKMKYRNIAAFYLWRSPVLSRYVNRRYFITSPYENEQTYLTQVSYLIDKFDPIVIPVGFIDTLLLAKHRKSLPSKGVILAPKLQAIKKAANKTTLDRVCHTAGVQHPTTIPITKASWKTVLNTLGLPLVVKGPSDDARPQYVFHASELQKIVTSRTGPLIAQQFVPGSGTGYFTVAQNGHILAEYAHRRVVETKPSGGPSLVAYHSQDSVVYDFGRKITAALNWSGVLMVEFRKHEESGDYYLIEINPKFWGSLELATAWGLDFPQYLLHSQEYEWTKAIGPSDYPIFHKRGTQGYFSWLLPGFSTFFRTNPKIWLRMLWHTFNRYHRTDVHLRDPPELLYSIISRFINALLPTGGQSKKNLEHQYKENIRFLFNHLQQEPIQALLFDLDGTLATLKINWVKVRQMLLLQGLLDPQEDSVMVALYRAQQRDSEHYRKMSTIVETYEEKAAARLSRSKAIVKGIKTLRQFNIKLAIVSKQTERNIQNAINRLGLDGLFDMVIGRDQGMQREHQASIALKTLQVPATRTIFVGDTVGDAVSAAKLFMTPIAVTGNPYRFQQFIELGIPSFRKVTDFFRLTQKRYQKR